MNKYDVAIIGSGPCGYVAAIRAAQLGLKVCIFEKDKIGGVCLNRGCIPTKVLCQSAEFLYNTKRSSEFGIDITGYALNFQKIQERKDAIVKKLCSGIETLMKARRIEIIKEKAEIREPTCIKAGNNTIESKYILIATGSMPIELPHICFDGRHVLSSTEVVSIKEIPEHIIIIGGGVIGCEFASMFNIFGSNVTIVEALEHLLPNEDEEVANKIEQIFKKRGIGIYAATKVEAIDKRGGKIHVMLSNGNTVSGDKALLCVGRRPNSYDIGIPELGIECSKGWVKVDEYFRTNLKNIYAAGDVKGGILLAHVASIEGISAVEHMAGHEHKVDYRVIPNCIFTHPEIASVGLTEKVAKEKGIDCRARKFLFSAIGKAHVLGETEGFIKIVVDTKTDAILGSQIIGPHATELIAELSLCVQYGITSEKLAAVIHAHPTLSEAVHEASESVHNRAIHVL